MRKLIMLIAVIATFAVTAEAQTVTAVPYAVGTRTEATFNHAINLKTTAIDTTLTVTGKYLVGILVGTNIASDSIIVKEGSATLSTMVFGSTASNTPIWIPLNCAIDSASFSVFKAKASDITVIYRKNY
jgi:hypothetical protein